MPPTGRASGSSPGASPYPSSRPGSSKPGTPANSSSAHSSLILRKQLIGKPCCATYRQPIADAFTELQKNPVDGFSAGLVDDDNILEWQIVIMGWVKRLWSDAAQLTSPRPADTLYEGGILKARLIFPAVSTL